MPSACTTISRRRGCIFAAVALLFALTGCAPAIAQPMPGSFAPLVRRVLPAVVNIAVTQVVNNANGIADLLPPALRGTPFEQEFLKHFGGSQQVQAIGSGFIIAPSGVIVTNNHVISGASRIVVSLENGRTLPARVISADPLSDIAVLKVDAGDSLPFVHFGDSNTVEVGDWVIAAGDPFGLGGTITAGIVSARDRNLGDNPLDRFLQIDAPINPGNSGGPLFDLQGQVIGMNTAIVAPTGGSVGIGFAIPSDTVRRVVEQLRSQGHISRGWLGVSIESLPGTDAGALVAGVIPGGPASVAGLRPGDVVLAVNGARIAGANDLIQAIATLAPGAQANLVVNRNGARIAFRVRVGERPANSEG